jgi:hypothetical protein
MPRKRSGEKVEQYRFAAETIVGWFEGMTECSGRVLINVPGTQWNVGTVVVRDSTGKQRPVRADRVFIKVQRD